MKRRAIKIEIYHKFDMQGVFMGHPGLYNKNQIRDKTLTGSYFFEISEVAEWQGYCIGLEKQYYMLRNVVNVYSIMCEYYEVCKNDGTLE